MNPMMAFLNCGGDILINMGAVAAIIYRDGENPIVTVQWVMGGESLYEHREARQIIDKLKAELPEPVDPNSPAGKIARLR